MPHVLKYSLASNKRMKGDAKRKRLHAGGDGQDEIVEMLASLYQLIEFKRCGERDEQRGGASYSSVSLCTGEQQSSKFEALASGLEMNVFQEQEGSTCDDAIEKTASEPRDEKLR